MWKLGKKREIASFWGYDTEFDINSRKTHSLQFFTKNKQCFIRTPQEALNFFQINKPRLVFGFNLLCDVGALENLLNVTLKKTMIGSQLVSWFKYNSKQPACEFRDLKPYADGMGLYKLSEIGKYVGLDKMDKELMFADPNSAKFKEYAMRDAEITYLFAKKIMTDLNLKANEIYTPASFSAKYVDLPLRYPKIEKKVFIPKIEEKIRFSTFAGRNECFLNGYLENYAYLDVVSLYPCAVLISKALNVDKVVECEPNEINLTNPMDFANYGWVEGKFESENDLWGLPVRVKTANQNRFVTGTVKGFYHTYDLLAAKVKIKNINRCWKPVFKESGMLNKYNALFLKKINKTYANQEEKMLTKMVLNALTGKLAQTKPIPSCKANFPAYHTLVACSHLIMSNIFNLCEKIAGMDTDSVFVPDCHLNLTKGELFNVDGIPIKMDVKHPPSDMVFLRSKMYAFLDGKSCAYHGWRYGYKSFLSLFAETLPDVVSLKKQVKRTLKTREKMALDMPVGFWTEKPIKKEKEEIVNLCKADRKRIRQNYDSFSLFYNKEFDVSFSHRIF